MHATPQYTDYSCKTTEDHHYSFRLIEDIDACNFKMSKERIRLTDESGEALRLKMHHDKGYSEVWSVANSPNRIRIDSIIVPNYKDIPKLKNKIKTYLVFG